jgi:hypothetical protein
MSVDQDAYHTERFVVFDEAHPAHVGGEIVDKIDIFDRAFAAFFVAEIELQIFRLGKHLKPFLKRFHIDRADLFPLTKQIGHKMTANETPAAANYDFFRFHFAIQHPNEPGTLPGKSAASTCSKLHALVGPVARLSQKPIAQEKVNK